MKAGTANPISSGGLAARRFGASPLNRRETEARARLSPLVAAAFALIALAALLAACSGSAPSGDSDPDVPSVISHSARVDADNGQTVFVSVALSAPARVAVEYENEFAGKFRTALSETAAQHAVPVVRLRANTVYQYAVAVEKADGAFAYQARGEFETGDVPGILATMLSETSGESSLDLIISDYYAHFPDGRIEWHIVMMDALGHVVWNYPDDDPPPVDGATRAVRVLPGGNIMYQLEWLRIAEITPLGEVVNELADVGIHHDFLPLADGRTLYTDRYELDPANGANSEKTLLVDVLSLYDPASGETRRVWDPTDFWDIHDRAQWGGNRQDWLHMNSLSKSADGGYIVSFRNINQVVSISQDFQTVRWRLGGPDSDFAFPDPADEFRRQHTATELPNGNILVFDNRAPLPEEEGGGYYSRALELRLDFENKTAVKAWEFSPQPRLYSIILSGAYRLDNGNTLINFGQSEDYAAIPIAIIEADARGREVFRLESVNRPTAEVLEKGPRRYRAYPGPKSIMGETTLRAPKRR